MLLRPLGSTDLLVSEYGLGCARIGGIFQQGSRAFVDLLAAARDGGINFFDTADMYSQGESEALIGQAFRRVRSRVVIATKAGYVLPARRKLAARLKPFLRPIIRTLGLRRERLSAAARGALAQDFSPAYLQKAVEGSLRRLRTDYLDLLQLHSPPADVIARGEWQSALDGLKRAGKVRHYGISCDSVEAGLAALRFPSVSCLQLTLNLLEQRPLDQLLPAARAQRVGIIARECLANGLLAKRADELDVGAFSSSPAEAAAREELLARYRRVATEQGTSLARVALEFVTRIDGVSVTLVGVRTLDQLRSLLGDLRQPLGQGGPLVAAPS